MPSNRHAPPGRSRRPQTSHVRIPVRLRHQPAAVIARRRNTKRPAWTRARPSNPRAPSRARQGEGEAARDANSAARLRKRGGGKTTAPHFAAAGRETLYPGSPRSARIGSRNASNVVKGHALAAWKAARDVTRRSIKTPTKKTKRTTTGGGPQER